MQPLTGDEIRQNPAIDQLLRKMEADNHAELARHNAEQVSKYARQSQRLLVAALGVALFGVMIWGTL